MFWEIPENFSQMNSIRQKCTMSRGKQRSIVAILNLCLIFFNFLSVALSESVSKPYPDSEISSQRPSSNINYRTKVFGVRYGEQSQLTTTLPPITPRLTVESYEEPKTETHAPIYDDSEESYVSEITEKTLETNTVRQVSSRALASDTSTPLSSESKDKSKTKTSRRRKVKRPHKSKSSTTPKSTDDDLGIPEPSSKNSSEKNLALEIGSEDGKYTLISTFFGNDSVSSPPGIISYAQSQDFVDDNAQSLGKLEENDIWLSEGHLLVVKGGDFDSTSRDKWQPIDAYVRDKSKPPLRIPLDTNNPPPFPVFVNQTGPPVFIGPPPPFPIPGYGELNESFDPSRLPPPGLIPLLPNGTLPGFFPPPPPHALTGPPSGGGLYGNGSPPRNGAYGYGQPPPIGNRPGENQPPPPPFFPFPPTRGGAKNSTLPPPTFFPFGPPPGNGPPPGFNPNFPQGGPPFFPPLVLNPKDNETDDPSIFLPPPYDFDYHEDNTTIVPPGPFAPGLVVPPPRDFYRVYQKPSQNKTIQAGFPQTTTPFGSFLNDKPQRANAKKPKFPITSPPDDSLEENFLPTPQILSNPPFPKKRKEGRIKAGKSYPLKISSDEVISNENPITFPTQQPQPLVFTPRQVSVAPTPKPLNYHYVHGKLKSVDETDTPREATPAPAFDALGYPNRAAQAPLPIPPSNYDYSKTVKKKSSQKRPKVHFVGQQGHRQIIPAEPTNPVYSTGNPIPIIHPTQNQFTTNDQPFYYTNAQPLQPPTSYFTPVDGTNRNTQKIYQVGPLYYQQPSQSPPSSQPTVPYDSGLVNTFYPSQLPTSLEKKRPRSRVIFPDEQDRRPRLQKQDPPSPEFYHNPFLYPTTQGQGYYSPVLSYPTGLTGQFLPNNFYQNGNTPGTFTTQFLQPNLQQPSFFQREPSPQYQQQPQNAYYNIEQVPQQEQQGQVGPLHSDILVNYREPLPQYNTESETVTTRSVLKAGPIPSAIYGTEPTGEVTLPHIIPSSFYSFERGGPGGFSYKIRL